VALEHPLDDVARALAAQYRDVLMNTATEEISHIEMLATAVALNLEDAPATADLALNAADRLLELAGEERVGVLDADRVLQPLVASTATC
jgi:Mn-containing catalase